MNTLPVRIVQLEPLRVVSVHGFGVQPEYEAWEKLAAYARPKGYLDNRKQHRIFGFNNPSPSPGSPNYGYEFWITVGPEAKAEEGVEIKNFAGGLYAVTRCEVKGDPGSTIPITWKNLFLWREDSQYKEAGHQWLEEHLSAPDAPDGEFVLDLYLPIAE